VGGRSRGARERTGLKFSIEPRVLDELGNLVSEVGSPTEARKAHREHLRDYTEEERVWMQTVVKRIIQRVGEVDANPTGQFALIDQTTLPKR
jgi:hypothetical protein